MPLYSFRCEHGCSEERYLPLAEYDVTQVCAGHRATMWRAISADDAQDPTRGVLRQPS